MKFLYSRANIQVANQDHDYLDRPFLEYWVDRMMSTDETSAIEEATRKQSCSSLWFEHRKYRITASRFAEICKATQRRDMAKLCQSIVSSNRITTAAVIHGQQFEAHGISSFVEKFGVQVNPVGLVVSQEYPYLGATPDGVVGEECVVEVKCPYGWRNSIIAPGEKFPWLEQVGEKIRLKPTSNYYHQVQGQMGITGRAFCYFIVFTFKDLFVEKIAHDVEFWKYSMLPKLELFYTKHFRPYVAGTM